MNHPAIASTENYSQRRRATDLPVLYLRVPDELCEAVQTAARNECVTVNFWCIKAIEKVLETSAT